MQINKVSNNPSFSAIRLYPAARTYLNKLTNEELLELQKAASEMKNYKYWDIDIIGYGPKIVNKQHQNMIINDFDKCFMDNCNEYKRYLKYDNAASTYKAYKQIDEEPSLLSRAISITRRLEKQYRKNDPLFNNSNKQSSLIEELMNEYQV